MSQNSAFPGRRVLKSGSSNQQPQHAQREEKTERGPWYS